MSTPASLAHDPASAGGPTAVGSNPPAAATATAARRHKWAHKHQLQQRYKGEHNRVSVRAQDDMRLSAGRLAAVTKSVPLSSPHACMSSSMHHSASRLCQDPAWFNHSKHILICSWSGRPIYSRYGDESSLAAYMGVITALISNFQRLGDTLREVRAGDWKFVFLCKGPIYLIAISRTDEPTAMLMHQLSYAHLQILSVLTNSVTAILESKPSYDIRHLMTGTETMLSDLINENDASPYFLLDAIPVLRMPKALRARISSCLRRSGMKNLLFGLLLGAGGKQLIHIVRGKDRVLHPQDCLLLINFLNNSQSLRSSEESWTPICLPHFSSRGYLYAYICYITDDLCLTLLTADSSDFANLRQAKTKIVDSLTKRDCLTDLTSHIASHAYHVHLEELDADLRTVMEVKHFLYRSDLHAQLVMCLPQQPYASAKKYKRWLFRRYQHILSRIGATQGEIRYDISTDGSGASSSGELVTSSQRRHQFYYEVSDFANLFCGQYTHAHSIWRPPTDMRTTPHSSSFPLPRVVRSCTFCTALPLCSSPLSATSWRVRAHHHVCRLHDGQVTHHAGDAEDSQVDPEGGAEPIHLGTQRSRCARTRSATPIVREADAATRAHATCKASPWSRGRSR